MNQETVSRSSLYCFRAIGSTLMICGCINVIMAINLQEEISSNTSQENDGVVTGFWSGLPLLMSGVFLFYLCRKQTKRALAFCVVPCVIAFTTSLIQAMESGMTYTLYRKVFGQNLDIDCRQDKVCNFVQHVNVIFCGMMISSIFGAVACLFGVGFGSTFLRTTTEETISPAATGLLLAQPSSHVISCTQITTPMQQPTNYGPPVYSIQPNHPQIETTRDSTMLIP